MRNPTPALQRLSAIPNRAGLLTRLACERARKSGIDLQPLLRRVGLTIRDIDDESVPLSATAQINCLNLLADVLNDRLLGFHLAQGIELQRAGFIYYIAASSETLGTAVQGIARYSALVNESVRLEPHFGGALRIEFGFVGVSRQSDRHQMEGWITAIFRCCRQITGRELHPLAIRLQHRRIAESTEIESYFGRIIQFGADKDELSFPARATKLPVSNADRFLNRLLVKYCDDVLARRKTRSGALRADVENAVAALLPHGPTRFETVARKLGVSPRTLRRKLSAEGVTFAGILDDLRFALAKRYLAERDLSISRIAWLLGYTEVSAFSHAFRRWTGRTPRALRSRQRQTPPMGASRRLKAKA